MELVYLNPAPDFRKIGEPVAVPTAGHRYKLELEDCKQSPAWDISLDGQSIDYRQYTYLKINKIVQHQFPPHIFQHFCQLRGLSLAFSQLNAIESEHFENADHLRHLNLSYNEITQIGARTFDNLKMLDTIDLSFNRIEFIDDHAFNHPPLLAHLDLRNNKLSTIDWQQLLPHPLGQRASKSPDISIQFDIDHFDVSNNPWQWSKCRPIAVNGSGVHLENIGLRKLAIFSRTWIVLAANNRISEIVLEEPNQRYNLQLLNVSHNSLTSVSILLQLEHLKDVDLSYNLLEAIDAEIFAKMEKLQTISFSHNKLKAHNFGYILNTVSLVTLDVSYNNMGSFKLSGSFPQLLELYIEGNNLDIFDEKMRQTAPKLNKIGLNDNSWNCGYLTKMMRLVQTDGMEMVKRDPLKNWTERKFNGFVTGVGCFDDGERSSLDNCLKTCRSAPTNADIEAIVNARLEKIESYVIAYLSKKINESNCNTLVV